MPASYSVNIYPVPTPGATDERLTVSSTALGFATTWKDGNNKFVVLDIQDADVMVTFDGSTPTASNGHRLYSGQSYTWHVNTADAAQFIRVSGDAIIHASPFTV
jgi:hypothetical protein